MYELAVSHDFELPSQNIVTVVVVPLEKFMAAAVQSAP